MWLQVAIKRRVSFLSSEKFTENTLKVNKAVQIALKKIKFPLKKKYQSAKPVPSKNSSNVCEEFSNSKYKHPYSFIQSIISVQVQIPIVLSSQNKNQSELFK